MLCQSPTGPFDQAYDIAKLVSEVLQQHGRHASIISPLLLSVAAEVRVTMNAVLALQWEWVWFDDSYIELHPFFVKTKGFVAPALVPEPNPTSVLPPALKVMSVPSINSLLANVPKPMADKSKQPVQGTCQSRKVDSDNESKRPKRRKPARLIIFVKPSKAVVPQTPAPAKQAKQADTNAPMGQPMAKGKVVKLAEGD
ncbi:hypothetical protein BDR04DRAFT_1158931 [Suillus decipiens]|nr:hypothetical protein BDR04DRAFT_1158931 [Suillus decipiens]